ncbi:MAG: SDR family NAD(P)-dependent oxidoreductase [Woeseiaceae bacterium]
MTYDLTGHKAVVSGAGRGIGRGCAEALANSGAEVIAIARSADDLASLASHASGRIDTWQGDVTDSNMHQRIRELNGLTMLVNNAGANRPQPFPLVDTASLDQVIDLNIRAAFLVSQAATVAMLRNKSGGSIVHMSSQMGHVGSPDRSVYCMTKHAIEGLTKACAVELAPERIRVNSVAPTFVETPLTKPMLDDPEFKKFVLGMIPSGRLASVDDIVSATLFLLSPQAGMVTGHSLVVDGGWTAR